MAKIMINGTDFSTPLVSTDAKRIEYDNTETSLQSTNVQDAISEVNSNVESALDSAPKYKKFTGTTDSYGQLNFGAISGEIISIFAYGDRLFATLQSNGIARITNQTGAIVTETQVTLMVLYI